jgi:hypothetical protein
VVSAIRISLSVPPPFNMNLLSARLWRLPPERVPNDMLLYVHLNMKFGPSEPASITYVHLKLVLAGASTRLPRSRGQMVPQFSSNPMKIAFRAVLIRRIMLC